MSDLEAALAKVTGSHRTALDWFSDHRGQSIAWQKIQEFSGSQSRLVNQAKGIYKPAYTDLALSIRTLQDGPYPDREVEYRADGGWVLQYYQEGQDPLQRDAAAANRGLMLCMEAGIPIGGLVKRKVKPGVEYEVLGLGLVTNWNNGYFTVEGYADDGSVASSNTRDAAASRSAILGLTQDFDASDFGDLREKSLSHVAIRRGQSAFRATLMAAYRGQCCLSHCALPDVLEAAHITPYKGAHSNHIQNGLLLRADLHTLFDLGLLAFDEGYCPLFAPKLAAQASYIAALEKRISLPEEEALWPSPDALRHHRKWCGL